MTAGPLPVHPTLYVDGISSLSVTGLRPHIVTGIFLQLLREHFADPARIEDPLLKSLVWVPKDNDKVTPDPTRTKILIDPVYRWNLQDEMRRPAIIVKRNQYTTQTVGIGMTQRFGLSEERDFPEAGAKYTLYFLGSHTLFCLGTDGGVAEVLSTEVARYLYQFAPVIRREFCFKTLEVAQIGEVSVVEESSENFVVPVVLRYAYEDDWTLAKQEPRLKGVSIGVTTGET